VVTEAPELLLPLLEPELLPLALLPLPDTPPLELLEPPGLTPPLLLLEPLPPPPELGLLPLLDPPPCEPDPASTPLV